jgi:hypothetical protein
VPGSAHGKPPLYNLHTAYSLCARPNSHHHACKLPVSLLECRPYMPCATYAAHRVLLLPTGAVAPAPQRPRSSTSLVTTACKFNVLQHLHTSSTAIDFSVYEFNRTPPSPPSLPKPNNRHLAADSNHAKAASLSRSIAQQRLPSAGLGFDRPRGSMQWLPNSPAAAAVALAVSSSWTRPPGNHLDT